MLAVLPFENLGRPEDEYFADGMTEEVTARLAGLHGLGVIGRTSAVQYKKNHQEHSADRPGAGCRVCTRRDRALGKGAARREPSARHTAARPGVGCEPRVGQGI